MENLQHEDGHSHILANTIPNCIIYDPTYGYEVAVIVQNGIQECMEKIRRFSLYYNIK